MSITILWRRLDVAGHEYAVVEQVGNDWSLTGTTLCATDRKPCKLDYSIVCDAGWRTRSAHVSGAVGARTIDLHLLADAGGHWRVNGEERPDLAGCIDVDLGFSPSTNLLPIRRLDLPVGEEAKVRAAWVKFPAMQLEVLQQTYRREAELAYRYTSAGGRFERVLEVDASGLVTHYPGIWIAEAP